ncbi:7999_t:CDS:2 [Cetraspora pellucida]|uniref:ATP-dependent DNA helicase n=1 Tax=Cetraspora pellucida TaxID=1433469 RepID=A0A9N9H1V8_9GLOM|nr:7999_t:CDS:2 [Cetraspora pellucida]
MSSQPLKCKGKENETSSECRLYSECDKLRYQEKKKQESAEERNERLAKAHEHMRKKRRCVLEPNELANRIVTETEVPENTLNIQQLSESDHKLLKKFRTEINNLTHRFCPTCKECFPSITLVMRECRRCYSEKDDIKKFSAENNMDPGDVSKELKCLTEIEEMLIAQVFPVVSVYYLHGGQYGYHGNSARSQHTFRDFTIRRAKVEKALYWLKTNNHYYKNIIIDDNVLHFLPDDGPVDDQLLQLQNENELQDDEFLDMEYDHLTNDTGDVVTRNFVPTPAPSFNKEFAISDMLSQMQTETHPIMWPRIEENPINEFSIPGYIACAFPTLYLTGDANLHAEHVKDVNPAEYFKHLLKYKGGRFARHPQWRYFALNSQMRWKALQEGRIYIKQCQDGIQLSVEEIQELANSDSHLADKVIRFSEDLRGTRQFWKRRHFELSDMIKQLKTHGMIFFTFSAADLHWPDLHNLMPHGENPVDGESEQEACKRRHQDLIDNPLIAAWFFEKRFKVFLEKVLIPKLKLEDWWYRFKWQHRGSVHIHDIRKIKDVPVFEWEKIKNNEMEINTIVQYFNSIVTMINPGLNAPIPERHPCQKSSEELNDDLHDYIELINKLQCYTRCGSSYCLRTNKEGQQQCRFGYPKDNIDHTFIHDNNGQPELFTARNDPYINPHNRLQLQGWHANVDIKPILNIHAALQYVAKYASKSEPRSATFSELLNKILRESRPSDSSLGAFQYLLLHTVAERDISAQETCHLLFGIPLYHSSCCFVTLNLNKEAFRWLRGTGNENFVTLGQVGQTEQSPLQRYWNRSVDLDDLSLFQLYQGYRYSNEFCRIKVLLHVHHRSLEQLTENNSVSWSEFFNRNLAEIENELNDLLGPFIDNLEEIAYEEENKQLETDEDKDETRPVDTFIQQVRSKEALNDENLDNNTIDYQTLNDNQIKIFKRLETYYNIIITGSNIEPLRIIIMGTAGTGKSYLINAIRQLLQEMAIRNGVESSPIIVLAPTGVTAFNIHGTTIHSALSIPISGTNIDIKGESLKQLQKKLNGVKYIIIDEKSMIGCCMLALIDMRLCQAFPEKQNQPFGGRSIILVSDFGQLPPVLDLPMYVQNLSHDPLSNDGITAYRQFQEVYRLDIIQCQAGDSEEQCHFRNILMRLRDGESTINDWKALIEVEEININTLKSLNSPIARIHAVHTGGNEASKADSDVAKGLESQILLARGTRVMLRANLYVEVGLVNGAMGTVHDILFEENQGPPALPIAIFVEFDAYNSLAIISTDDKRTIPIPPIRRSWDTNTGTYSRLQIPLSLVWAIMVHKSQGLTLTNARISLGKKEYACGLSFVAISHVRALKDILFNPFSLQRLQKIRQSKRMQERKNEENQLISMIT